MRIPNWLFSFLFLMEIFSCKSRNASSLDNSPDNKDFKFKYRNGLGPEDVVDVRRALQIVDDA